MASRLAILLILLLAALAAPSARAGAIAASPESGQLPESDLELAVLEADDKVQLPDLLSGRARIGFNPVVRRGTGLVATPGRTTWLRVRAEFADDGRPRFFSLPRQSIQSLRIYSAAAPDGPLAETGVERQLARQRWPDELVLPMVADASGTTTAYVAIQGRGLLNLQPRVLDEPQVQREAVSARRGYLLLYGALVVIGLLAILRRWTRGEQHYRLAQGAFACLVAALVDANHLQFAIGGASLGSRPNLPTALWLLACAGLMRATVQYAGHEKVSPAVGSLLDRAAWVVAALAIAALFVPLAFLPQLQVAGGLMLGACAVACCASLFLDPRHWRWSPILIWIGVLLALLAIPLAWWQLMHQTMLVRRGFQLLLALLLGTYLLLPWVRQALRERAQSKRALVVEPSAEEKIAHAREWLMSSLEAGMQGAAEADMEWIAYRRLMAGLKPVLPQTAAAVIAMNYHNEDLLLVEPNTAEARFRMLLAQRASLLKNLSRSLAPQQIVLDFDGPEGPLDHVMLAIIPLPIERPGWGALVIERDKEANYSEAELDLCAEFAALATTAADEAAEVMQQRHVNEVDPDTGAFRESMLDTLLARAMEGAIQKRRPVSVLHVGIDGFEQLAPGTGPGLARSVTDTIRDEIDFGETICRRSADEFLVLLSGRAAGEVRGLAERICAEILRHPLPGADGPLTVSVGAAQMQGGERSPLLAIERAARALDKARSYGGNQAQMVTGTGP